MELKNLKASFIFFNDLINKEIGSIKKEIFKIDNATFTIYKHTPTLLNVTGIKSLDEIKKYKKILEKKYNQCPVKVKLIIHSSQKKITKILIWTKSTHI